MAEKLRSSYVRNVLCSYMAGTKKNGTVKSKDLNNKGVRCSNAEVYIGDAQLEEMLLSFALFKILIYQG